MRIYDIPVHYRKAQVVSMIYSSVAKPIYMVGSESNIDKGRYLCVMVEVDVKEALPDSIVVDIHGVDCEREFEYEWKPQVCTLCQRVDHVQEKCPQKVVQVKPKKMVGKWMVKHQGKMVSRDEDDVLVEKSQKNPLIHKVAEETITTSNTFQLLQNTNQDEDVMEGLQSKNRALEANTILIQEVLMGVLQLEHKAEKEEVVIGAGKTDSVTSAAGVKCGNPSDATDSGKVTNAKSVESVGPKTNIAIDVLLVVLKRASRIEICLLIMLQQMTKVEGNLDNMHYIGSGVGFYVTAIYAANRATARRDLWQSLKVQATKVQGPWIALGDWNMVRYNHEKKGRLRIPQSRLDEFNSVIYDIKMDDIPINNGDWSWSSLSDHYGLATQWHFDCSEGPKPFKFLKICCVQGEVDNVVAKAWELSVKDAAKEWNKTRGLISEQLQVAREDLQKIQLEMLQGIMNEDCISREREATGKLQHVLDIEEIFWAKKSRSKWLKEGDKCTKIFHNLVKQRRGFNVITKLQNLTGEQFEDPKTKHLVLIVSLPGFFRNIRGLLDKILSIVLLVLIGPEQSAFIKNRRLHDNILLVSDLVKDFGKKHGVPFIELKVDLKKAYDSVDWKYILWRMKVHSFSDRWIGWISQCITIAKFSILCNGVPAGYFGVTRGIRQSCPLSLFLFSFVTEYFSTLMMNGIQSGRIHLCRAVSTSGMCISHVFYDDDLLVVVKADVSTAKSVDVVFKQFQDAFGLQVNKEKSSIIFSKAVRGRRRLSRIHNFQTENFPFTYLGLPLSNKKLRVDDYRVLLDKIPWAAMNQLEKRFKWFIGVLIDWFIVNTNVKSIKSKVLGAFFAVTIWKI
ncbi:uncharacterized protein LOC132309354 [Cornus florida]|uniref:uncharacterized protein LOC132309354 n=1 Tax=Cornus florida TaxID=4283 RepID=UPI00289879A1|nr:uncharacterized protein LOC132309354 [Cornus florida]